MLGAEDSKNEIQALVDEGYPFVFIGRRELPGSEISYTAADYASATAELMVMTSNDVPTASDIVKPSASTSWKIPTAR